MRTTIQPHPRFRAIVRQAAHADLAQALALLLDRIDYTRGACSITAMVGARIDRQAIEDCRALLARGAA